MIRIDDKSVSIPLDAP